MKELLGKKINRLVIVGNGFDLAHGLKTTYNDFMVWYFCIVLEEAKRNYKYEDPLIKVIVDDSSALSYLHNQQIHDVASFVQYYYIKGFNHIIGKDWLKFDGWDNNYRNPFNIQIKSDFFGKLLADCNSYNWVDIENQYYNALKETFRGNSDSYAESLISELNHCLKWIISRLEIYLSHIKCDKFNEDFRKIINAQVVKTDFSDFGIYENNSFHVDNTLLLNFNYTDTLEHYVEQSNGAFEINYIHGKLNDDLNRVIFGFGDELDENYVKFEQYKAKGVFEHIKSFWYFKTSNYHNLIRFIDSKDFQVYILGHSCGLSDRTMLNMIFEHQNCQSIKIFYYQKGDYNNYTELTQEISRHFKDKQKMRKRIVPLDKSNKIPQVSNN